MTCWNVLAAVGAVALLAIIPLTFVKDEDWDRQWKRRDDFLSWLGFVLDDATPALKPSATTWVFASPALTSTIEREVVASRFRILNSIRWVKEAGWHQKAEIEAQRRYLTACGVLAGVAMVLHDMTRNIGGEE